MFLGIAVPAAVGGVVFSFGNARVLPWILGIAGVLGTVQLIATIWSVVAEWNSTATLKLTPMNIGPWSPALRAVTRE